jgi:hypothetical protein
MRSITRADLTGRSAVELSVLAAMFNRLLLAAQQAERRMARRREHPGRD